MKDMGKLIMICGAILLLAGFVVWIGGDKLKWFGNLPGDIRIRKKGFTFYMPVVTMILVSILLTFILWIFRKIS